MIQRTHGVRNARHHFACDAIILPYTCSNPWCDDKYFYTSAVYRNYVVGICFLPCLALTDRLHDNKWCNRFTRLLKLKTRIYLILQQQQQNHRLTSAYTTALLIKYIYILFILLVSVTEFCYNGSST